MTVQSDLEHDPTLRLNWVVVGIAIASVATAVTTGLGMYAIFGNLAIAAVMTILAQMVLVATSWMLGKDIARLATGRYAEISAGRGFFANVVRYVILVSIFLLAFSICWFFSFRFYYTTMFQMGEDTLLAEQQPLTFSETFLPELRRRVLVAYDDDAKRITDLSSVKTFLAGLSVLEREVQNPKTRTQIADLVAAEAAARKKRADEVADAIVKQQERAKKAQEEKAALGKEIDKAQRDLAAKQEQIEPYRKQVEEEEKKRQKALAGAAAEEAQGREGRQAGCGEFCRREKDAAERSQRKIEDINRTHIRPFENLRQTAESAVVDKNKNIEAQNRALAEAERAIETGKRELDSLKTTASSGTGQGAAVEQLLQQLATRRTAFNADPNPDTYATLSNICIQLRDPLASIPEIARNLGAVDCRPDAVAVTVRARPDVRKAQGVFAGACSAESLGSKLNDIIAGARRAASKADLSGAARQEALAEALDRTQRDVVQPCVGLASVAGAKTDDLQERIRLYVQTNTLRQDSFSQTRNAAFSLFAPGASSAARLGAAIALAQDLFVLLLAILGDIGRREKQLGRRRGDINIADIDWSPRPDDSPLVVAAKAILRASRDRSDAQAVLPKSFGEDFPPEIRDNVMQILRQLLREGLLRRNLTGVQKLSREAIEEVERIVTMFYAPTKPLQPLPGKAADSTNDQPAVSRAATETGETVASVGTPGAQSIHGPIPSQSGQDSNPASDDSASNVPNPSSDSRADVQRGFLESARRSAARRQFETPAQFPPNQATHQIVPGISEEPPIANSGSDHGAGPFGLLASRAARARVRKEPGAG